VITGPDVDRGSPFCSIVTPSGDGTSRHLVIADLQNNLKNDLRGEAVVDSQTLAPRSFVAFEIIQGGLGSQPESAALARRFGFDTLLPGF
jgi:hypothetical protein